MGGQQSKVEPESPEDEKKRAPPIYTKTGDLGYTGLLGSSTKVPKWSRKIKAYGAVDELNAHLGAMRAALIVTHCFHSTYTIDDVYVIQHELFIISSWLSRASYRLPDDKLKTIDADDIAWFERDIDNMTQKLAPLRNFIYQDGDAETCSIHIARTVCRRAETAVIKAILSEDDADHLPPMYSLIIQYMNRLSDWLFTLSRYHMYLTRQKECSITD